MAPILNIKILKSDDYKDSYLLLFGTEPEVQSYGKIEREGDIKLPGVTQKEAMAGRLFIYSYPPGPVEPQEAKISDMDEGHGLEVKLIPMNGGWSLKLPKNDIVGPGKKDYNFNISGHVRKDFGNDRYLPVYMANVHALEVAKLTGVIPKLPEDVLLRWRWEWLSNLAGRGITTFNEPEPKLPVKKGVVIPGGTTPKTKTEMMHIGEIINIIQRSASGNQEEETFEGNRKQIQANKLKQMIDRMQEKDPDSIAETIISDLEYWLPYLCRWHWIWPYVFRTTKIGDCMTNKDGMFEIEYKRTIKEWDPDVYIYVDFLGKRVYNPCIALNTYRNYQTDTDIIITVDDPLVRGISPGPLASGNSIEFKSIGDGAFVQSIPQVEPARLINMDGKVFKIRGLRNSRSPFGGTISFRVVFSQDMYQNGARYYRWSYRMIEQSTNNHGHKVNSDDSLVPVSNEPVCYINDPVYIGYTDIGKDGKFQDKLFNLGPIPKNALPTYKIPTNRIEATLGRTPDDVKERFWNSDIFHTTFDTNTKNTPAGLYEFRLELLDEHFNTFYTDSKDFQLANKMNPTKDPSENASELYLNTEGKDKGLSGQACGFKIILRIDNHPMEIQLYNPQITNGIKTDEASSNCGFLKYTNPDKSSLTLFFRAEHPNDFGSFVFGITRGLGNGVDALSVSGDCTTDEPMNPSKPKEGNYTLVPGAGRKCKKNVVVNRIMGDCDSAAFAETLTATAWATNGSVPLEYLNRSAVASFALHLDVD